MDGLTDRLQDQERSESARRRDQQPPQKPFSITICRSYMYAMFRKASDTIISPSKMATIMTPPSDEGPATTTVGRSRRKRFSLAGLNLGSAVSKVAEKEASEKNNSDKGCGSANREGMRTGTGRTSSSSATSLLSPKAAATADAVGNSNISASTAVASRDPRARRGSLPIFDRISTCAPTPSTSSSTRSTEEMGRDGRVKEADDDMLGGRSGGGNGNGNGNSSSSSTAAVASGIGAEVTANNTDFERRGPPRRRHSASATQIEAISRQAFGGGDAAAYESDSSSDSSAWLDSDSDSDDED